MKSIQPQAGSTGRKGRAQGVLLLAGFAVGFAITRRVGIGAVAGATVLIACGALADEPYTAAFGVALGLLVIVRHRRNIVGAWQDWRDDGSRPQDA